jgi:hypothetical protein
MLEPPYERKGRGTPVMGINPSVIPIFSNVWKANHESTPTHTSLPKASVDLRAIVNARITIVR